MSRELYTVILFVVFLLFSGTIHELCHALAADYFGDDTPRLQNRLTLNPIPHIDPVWTLIMPVALWMMSGVAFGGAKPVSMNPANFRNPERDFTIAAAVGPLSNFLLALVALFLFVLVRNSGFITDPQQYAKIRFPFEIFYLTNIILGVFNLIPIPPLDGSRILRFYLPPRLKQKYDRLSGQYGMIIIFGLLFVSYTLDIRFLSFLIDPFLSFFYYMV